MQAADNPQLKHFYWLGLLLGLVLSFWYQTNQIIDGDQLQMIHRGYLALYEGQWSSTGNTASVVGNVPGYLSTWVVAGPLMLWDSPYSPIIFLTALRLAGFLMIAAVIAQAYQGAMLPRVLLLLMLWLNPWVQFDNLLYNPAYLIFCAGLHMYSAWRMRDAPSFGWTVLHVAAIALAVQLHFSWPLLVFISLYLWWRQLIRVNWWGVLVAVGVSLLSLLPYLSDLLSDPDIARHEDPGTRERYIGWGALHVYPVLKSVLYWLRYGAWAFPSKLVNDAGFDWLTSWHLLEMTLIWIWRVIMYALSAVTLVLAAWANVMAFQWVRRYWRPKAGPVLEGSDWLLLYSLGAFVATLVSAGLAPLVFNYWHLILILPAAVMPVLWWLIKTFGPAPRVCLVPLVWVAAVLVAVNLVAINDSRKFSWQASYADQVNQHVSDVLTRPAR